MNSHDHSELGAIPATWEVKPLADLAELFTDGDWIETKDQGGSDYRLLQVSNIGVGRFRETGNFRYVTADTFDRLSCTAVREGDLLISRMPEPIGRAWLVRQLAEPAITAVDVTILRPSSSIIGGYLSAWLNSPRALARAESVATGTTRKRISRSALGRLDVPVPPVDTQRRIAAVVSAFENLIGINERRIELVETLSRSLYREWFVDFRFPGHEHVELTDSEQGPIPQGWEASAFSEVAKFINGFAFKPAHHGGAGRPIIKIKELKHGVTKSTPRYSGNDLDSRYLIEPGDLLMSWSADLGVYLWPGEPALLNQHLFKVLPQAGVTKYFLAHALRYALPAFRSRAQGTTMKHIKRSALNEVKVSVPPSDLLKLFSGHVAPLHDQAILLATTNRRLHKVRDLVLPRLVTGRMNITQVDLGALAPAEVA